MQIIPISSGSKGNCYLVTVPGSAILIDCGIPIKSIKENLWHRGFNLSDIDGCLVSHEHGDHVKAAQALADMGVDIYTSAGTAEAAGLHGHRIHTLNLMIGVPIKSFYVYPYLVEHDAKEPLAFSVSCKDTNERLLYITDAMYFRYNISGVTHLMIEANYDPEIIAENAENGRIDMARAKRTVNSHMSLETAKLTVERMDKSRLREIWLLHLSNDNAANDFKERIQEVSGVPVYVA